MTLRTIESEFTEELKKQALKGRSFDFSLNGPLYNELHPKLIWTKLLFKYGHPIGPHSPFIKDWSYQTFENLQTAQKNLPLAKTINGKPWRIFEFLRSEDSSIIIDFSPLGAIYLTQEEFKPQQMSEEFEFLLPIWSSYALSSELWGENGKWPKFHERLNKLFKNLNLLEGEAIPGYYPLRPEAAVIQKRGITGTQENHSFILALPWTFSRQDLEKLEEVFNQEF